MTGYKRCLQADYNNGRRSFCLKTERNNICVANVSSQQQGIMKSIFPVCMLFSNLVVLNTVSSQVRVVVCKCLFRIPNAVIF
jgi:hypothetical protein